ncbi:ribosomal prt L17 [Hepatospora eriocheir]|uniref:Ribosomal prt L17 n=1 Tax=Hepatospora eriocheir TaxID=1081669 RepID=A0A1X0QGI0_9MICR|nr:ribosomal prt L17 [Hepatospora eriocheir]ORD98888.1 ribosomal prt L17 [Hepatospora eriocheir]
MSYSYNATISDESNTVKACIQNAKVSFKNTRETCSTLRGRTLQNCFEYLNNVIRKIECVPMRRYARGVGNTTQARKFSTKNFVCTKGRWPVRSAALMLRICKNIKNNALNKGLVPENLIVDMVTVNKAPIIFGRCFRAHGRVNSFNKSPCHVKMVCKSIQPRINADDEVVEVKE